MQTDITTTKKNPLEKFVSNWIDEKTNDYDGNRKSVYEDLQYGGCISGMVGELIYYSDTVAFFKKYKKEIYALVDDFCSNTGESIQDFFGHANNFPLDKNELRNYSFSGGIDGLIRSNKDIADQIMNWLAWFGFEETAYRMYSNEFEN